jgi:uracil-DNA glycosylase
MSQPPSPHDELRFLTRQLRAYLEALQAWGVQYVPGDSILQLNSSNPEPLESKVPATLPASESSQALTTPMANPPLPPSTSRQPSSQETQEALLPTQEALLPLERPAAHLSGLSLSELEAVAKQCTQCRLHRGRTHVVFGVGNPQADLMFAGEAPGRDEDQQGEPFVGRAGQLLTRIIEAIGMKRQDVYIANVIKCRPPNNRNPAEDEIDRCEPYLIRQIELVKPRLIVALGTFAAQTLLKTKLPISQLRGRFHTYQGVKLMPTFHPAFLLRNPERKRAVWEDMQAVQRELRRLQS